MSNSNNAQKDINNSNISSLSTTVAGDSSLSSLSDMVIDNASGSLTTNRNKPFIKLEEGKIGDIDGHTLLKDVEIELINEIMKRGYIGVYEYLLEKRKKSYSQDDMDVDGANNIIPLFQIDQEWLSQVNNQRRSRVENLEITLNQLRSQGMHSKQRVCYFYC